MMLFPKGKAKVRTHDLDLDHEKQFNSMKKWLKDYSQSYTIHFPNEECDELQSNIFD